MDPQGFVDWAILENTALEVRALQRINPFSIVLQVKPILEVSFIEIVNVYIINRVRINSEI